MTPWAGAKVKINYFRVDPSGEGRERFRKRVKQTLRCHAKDETQTFHERKSRETESENFRLNEDLCYVSSQGRKLGFCLFNFREVEKKGSVRCDRKVMIM